MAKLRHPLHSIDAHGSVGPRLTFSSRRSGPQVRYQKSQLDAKSGAQLAERALFDEARGKWNTLSDADKAAWDIFNRG